MTCWHLLLGCRCLGKTLVHPKTLTVMWILTPEQSCAALPAKRCNLRSQVTTSEPGGRCSSHFGITESSRVHTVCINWTFTYQWTFPGNENQPRWVIKSFFKFICTLQFASSRIMKYLVDISNGAKINMTVFSLYFWTFNEGVWR